MAESSTPAVEARGVFKSYLQGGAEAQALRGVDLSVHPGEFCAMVGPSGSGKSTFLHILGLMDEPSQGEVVLFGSEAGSLREEQRCAMRNRHLGFVFQFDSLLPEFTVLENVTLPARVSASREGRSLSGSRAKAKELLARFGIEALERRFPQELSGGERQRAAIARALINEPALLLADEPTGNLDRGNGESVFRSLKQVSEQLGVAVILATHNEYALSFAARILHLVDGRLSESPAAESRPRNPT